MKDRIIDKLIKKLQYIKKAEHDLDAERPQVRDAIEEIYELLKERLSHTIC